jgi:hypothetical protein
MFVMALKVVLGKKKKRKINLLVIREGHAPWFKTEDIASDCINSPATFSKSYSQMDI